jgi:transposase
VIEKTIRGRSADERCAVRQERSKPLVVALRSWLKKQLARVLGKAKIADAIRYGLNHWDGLTRFLDDGRIELDTNIVERSIRPVESRSAEMLCSACICSKRPAYC